jgi:hypothetical protein
MQRRTRSARPTHRLIQSMSIEDLTFVHRFGRGIQCELRVSSQAPAPGLPLAHQLKWTGRPRKKHTNQYRQWILLTTQHLCDLWNERIVYALSITPNQTEVWGFEPGKAPRLIKEIPFGLP